MKNLFRCTIYCFVSLITVNAQAFTACGFSIIENTSFKFRENGPCVYDIEKYKNYAHMNSVVIFDKRGVDDILTDSANVYVEDEKRYFFFDETNDPNFTQNTKKNDSIQQVSVNGMRGYIAEWIGFMQALPHYRRNDGYSLNVKCISAVIGDDLHTLQTRFCAPHTAKGDFLIENYKTIILNVKQTNQ